jgi:hypothetical protein
MNALWIVAIAAAAAGAVAAAEWLLLRAAHRKAVDALRARHVQQQLDTGHKLEQAKRQIGLLKQELEAVRLEARQRRHRTVATEPANGRGLAREALERQLDAAAPRARALGNGFADTLPAPPYGAASGGLLMN